MMYSEGRAFPALPPPPPPPDRRRRKSTKKKGPPDQPSGYIRQQQNAIYELQMREAVVRWMQEGVSKREIARRLGQTPPTITRYFKEAIRLSARRARFHNTFDESRDQRRLSQTRTLLPSKSGRGGRGPGAGLFIMSDPQAYQKARQRRAFWPAHALSPPSSSSNGQHDQSFSDTWESHEDFSSPHPPRPPKNPTEILDAPDIVQLRQDCLNLRKRMWGWDKISETLGITGTEARRYTAEALQELVQSEHMHADLQRQLMIEQIDQMIEAIHPMSTGLSRHHIDERQPVVLEAIDRMLKLMKQKSDLMGLSQVPAVDIRIKLQALAAEGGYDIQDIEEIAREVLHARKMKLPEFGS